MCAAMQDRTVCCRIAALAVLLGFVCPCSGAAGTPLRRPTVQEVLGAWKARQDRVKTLRFEWVQSETTCPALDADMPRHDVTHEVALSVSMRGSMLRHSSRGPRWSPDQKEFLPKWYLNVYGGQANKAFFGYAGPKDKRFFQVGFVENKVDRNVDAGSPDLQAIALTYRIYDSDISGRLFDLSRCSMSPKTGSVDGRECIIVEQPGTPPLSYWVDPERDCVIVRYIRGSGERLERQVDVSYTHDQAHGWVPAGWKYVAIDPASGKMRVQIVARVTKYEINCDIPLSEFEFEFPVGTRVSDYNSGESYIVGEGGKKRIITDQELRGGATYEEMLATESGKALTLRRRSSFPAWGYAIGIAVVLLGLAAVLHLRRRARSRQ